MNTCSHCPSLQGTLKGHDPLALDCLNSLEYCEDKNTDYMYCPWEDRNCPMHLKLKKISTKLLRQGKPTPWKLDPQFDFKNI